MEKNKLKEKMLESKTKLSEKIKELNKKKIIIPAVIIGILIIIIFIFSIIFSLLNINNNNIVTGVKIEGIDVSGLSTEEAKEKLELIYNEKKEKDISLKYEEYTATLNPELLDTNFNLEQAVEDAVSIGKDSNIFVNNYNILFALIGKKDDIKLNITINEEETTKTIEDIGTNLPGAVIESDYYIEEDKLIITKGQDGVVIDTESLIKEILESLHSTNLNEEFIEIPVITKTPEEIDIDKIHEEVYKEVQDAYYTKDPFQIYPEVEGVDFDVEAAKELLKQDQEQYEIQLIITKPSVTIAQIGSEAFPDLLATFTTRYDASNTDRTTNLNLACQKINDKVVLAGETFSYNQTLGERTIAAGYKNAKIYSNGEVVDGLGGGICQISSTLYNAVLMANMEVTERRNHQFVTSYLPAGRDATVVYGLTDFKFKNTRTYAVRIKASVSNGIATVSIYGIKEENEYTVSFNTKTISTIPYTVKYEDDSTLEAGQEEITQKGANGLITETYITKSLNGVVVSTNLLSRDTYSAMERIIKRGTKSTTTTQSTTTETKTKTDTEKKTTTDKSDKASSDSSSGSSKKSTDTNKSTSESSTTSGKNTTTKDTTKSSGDKTN